MKGSSQYLSIADSRAAEPVELPVWVASGAHFPVGVRAVSVLHEARTIENGAVFGRAGPTPRMPNGATLQIHFLAVAKGVATFRASRARRVEMVVVASLQNLSAYESCAVRAFHAVLFLVVLLTKWHSVSENNTRVTYRLFKATILFIPCAFIYVCHT